jgi:CheY-like chemotaxis protein
LVDDDTEDQELLENALLKAKANAEIHAVSSGKQALDYLNNCERSKLPSLIVLDFNMPGLNGAEVLDKLSSEHRYKEIPKVVWTTSGSESLKKLCLEKGAVYHFRKAYSLNGIYDAAKQMLKICETGSPG